MEARDVAEAIGVELVGKLPHGEGHGAYEVRTASGARAALKFGTDDVFDFGSVPARLDALRARGCRAARRGSRTW